MASRPWAQAEGAGSGRDLRSGRHGDYGTWLRMDMTLAVGAVGVWNNISVRGSQGTRTQGRRRSKAQGEPEGGRGTWSALLEFTVRGPGTGSLGEHIEEFCGL